MPEQPISPAGAAKYWFSEFLDGGGQADQEREAEAAVRLQDQLNRIAAGYGVDDAATGALTAFTEALEPFHERRGDLVWIWVDSDGNVWSEWSDDNLRAVQVRRSKLDDLQDKEARDLAFDRGIVVRPPDWQDASLSA